MTEITVVLVELVDKGGRSIPSLVISDGHKAIFHRELLASTIKFISNGWSRSKVERYVLAVRGLLHYYLAIGAPSLEEHELQVLVWNYLSSRLYGTIRADGSDESRLYWRPNRWSTVRQDCRAIADYSDFCAATYGYLPLLHEARLPHQPRSQSHAELQRLRAIVERSFLGHLRLLDKPRRCLPTPGRKQPSTSGIGRTVVTAQQAWDLIDAEENPVMRMIWLLGFFGGPRISEQLNMWRCDVLPADCREVLFRDDPFREYCLVVLANPWDSTYCTSLGDARTNRRQFLSERYKLHPRPDLRSLDGGENRSLWAGWKSMLETNENRHISQIFWVNEGAAEEYWRLHQWLMERHADLRTSHRHPYLYINLDHRRPDRQGQPTTLSNVGKSFERAVRRIGLEPYRLGANRHGMRHFYKQYLSDLGIEANVRKLFLHHRSIESQDAYGGLHVQDINHALSAGRRRYRVEADHEQ